MELNHILDQIEITPELLERTNPVFQTAKFTLFQLAASGDSYAEKIVQKMGMTEMTQVAKGSQNIRIQQEKGVLQKKRLEFVKDQLEFSKELEKECMELRKWNHDIENHLLSLSYLMDMKQYQTAQEYSQAVGQKMPDLHET